MAENPPARARDAEDALVEKIPLRGKRQLTPVFLPGYSHGQETWRATVPGLADSNRLSTESCTQCRHARTHTCRPSHMHARTGLTCSRAQGGSGQLTAPGLCAYLEEAYLLVLKYEPEKQVSDLASIWEKAKLFSDGFWRVPSFFPFFLS